MRYREAWRELPAWIKSTLVVLVVLSWIPLAFIVKARLSYSDQPRIHPVPDMDQQPKLKPQQASVLFADGRAMRPPVPGAVAWSASPPNDPVFTGKGADGEWLSVIPLPVSMAFMRRGQERFGIYCAPCHGLDGAGDGMVAKRAEALQEGTWVPPASFHTDTVRGKTDGELFHIITNGVRKMPAYGPQIPVQDRWAIVAYVRALERSRHATPADVPPEQRAALR